MTDRYSFRIYDRSLMKFVCRILILLDFDPIWKGSREDFGRRNH